MQTLVAFLMPGRVAREEHKVPQGVQAVEEIEKGDKKEAKCLILRQPTKHRAAFIRSAVRGTLLNISLLWRGHPVELQSMGKPSLSPHARA